jgi:hypothetical protein
MRNSREWYEAKALEALDKSVIAVGKSDAAGASRFIAAAEVFATLANAADRRSHSMSITDPVNKETR